MSAAITLVVLALATWAVSLRLGNVTIVDVMWPLFFVAVAVTDTLAFPHLGPRAPWVVAGVTVWGIRLSVHLAARSWGQPEDRRYLAIRRRNEPHFAWKSLYLVFLLQAALAWVVSLPLGAAIASTAPPNALDLLAVVVWGVGFVFEAVGDWQLARFRRDPANTGRVLDVGLWRTTRHPNYFGDCCVWWGFGLTAAAGGAWWTLVGPTVMTVLLLRVSGVTLLERTIAERRPEYREYMRRTNAFVPGPRR